MGMQYSITAVGGVILQTAVNGLGSSCVAAMTTGSRIAGFFLVMFDALGSAMATFGGQNIGAKKLDRVSKGLFTASTIGMIYSILAGAVLMLFGEKLALIFVDSTETEIIANIVIYLRIESGFYFLLLLVCCVRFTIQGMGFSGFAVFAGVLEMIARTLVALVLVPLFGFTGVCFASPVAWIMADVFLVPAFFHAKKKLQQRFDTIQGQNIKTVL